AVKRPLRRVHGPGDLGFSHFGDRGEHFLRTGVDRLKGRVHRSGHLLAVNNSAKRLPPVAAKLGELLWCAKGGSGQGANLRGGGRHARRFPKSVKVRKWQTERGTGSGSRRVTQDCPFRAVTHVEW